MDKDLLRGLEINKGDFGEWYKYLVALYQDDQESYPYVVEFRLKANKVLSHTPSAALLDLVHKTYLLTAPYNFDDFMIAVEWDRPPQEKFWMPRRRKLLPLCKLLEDLEYDRLDELFISLPPRVGKTTLINFFTLWVMLRNSERSNLYCSFSDAVANVFYNGLLEVLQDPYTYNWHDIFPNRQLVSTNAKDLIMNIDRKKRYGTFTARSIYGTLNGACDCNGYEIADDLVSGIEEAMSPDRLNALWSRVDNDYLTRGKPGTKRLWIGTRWSVTDPIARRIDLLDNDPKFRNIRYRIINIPALNKDDESNFSYDYGVGFDTEFYQQRRASFERNNDLPSWQAQYQGNPVERGGTVFMPEDLRYYNGELPLGDADRIFMAVDPAWGGGDFVASPIIYQYGEDLYVHDVIYNNGDKRVTVPLIANKAIQHNVSAITIEATRTTQAYSEEVDSFLREMGKHLNVTSTTKHFAGSGKQQRIFDKAPDIREKMVFRASGYRSKEYEQFMQNVFAFKVIGKNKNDDAPDSLAIAINTAFFGAGKVEITKRFF